MEEVGFAGKLSGDGIEIIAVAIVVKENAGANELKPPAFLA